MGSTYTYSNILGDFVFDEKINLIKKGKEKNAKIPDEEQTKEILRSFKQHRFFKEFRDKNIEITKKDIKNSVKYDLLIIHTIKNIENLEKVANSLAKELRGWYEIYNPEFSKSIASHEKFTELIIKKERKELLKELKLKEEESMGADLEKEDIAAIMNLAKEVSKIYRFKEMQQKYLETIIKKTCPNITAITGPMIGAKLLEHAGSLKRLTEMPASTIQILGAEKALFRHMKTGAKSPKYGVLFQHPLISKIKKQLHGKAARTLADKICLAAKIDYFKGEFIGDKLKKELEEKFK